MAALYILSDENCLGRVEAIFAELHHLGFVELRGLELLSWEKAGLAKGTGDEAIYCV